MGVRGWGRAAQVRAVKKFRSPRAVRVQTVNKNKSLVETLSHFYPDNRDSFTGGVPSPSTHTHSLHGADIQSGAMRCSCSMSVLNPSDAHAGPASVRWVQDTSWQAWLPGNAQEGLC